MRSALKFFDGVRRSRYFRHGLILGLVVGLPVGWLAKPPPRLAKVQPPKAAVTLPVEVSRGFPRGEDLLFTVRVKNTSGRVLTGIEASCAIVDSTGALLGSGAQAWSAVGPDQTVVGVIRVSSLLGSNKADCQARGS